MATFLSVGPYFEEGGRGSRKFWPEAEILGIFSIEVAPKELKLRTINLELKITFETDLVTNSVSYLKKKH